VPIAVRICPTKMSRDDYTRVMADLERTRGGAPEGRIFHAGLDGGMVVHVEPVHSPLPD